MYDDIVHLALDQQLISELNQPILDYKKLPIWKRLQKAEDTESMKEELRLSGLLNFDSIFQQPVGYHCLKGFLFQQQSVDKLVFLKDVERFKALNGAEARAQVAAKIFDRFCAADSLELQSKQRGQSIFVEESSTKHSDKSHLLSAMDAEEKTAELPSATNGTLSHSQDNHNSSIVGSSHGTGGVGNAGGVNSIGVYGSVIDQVRKRVEAMDDNSNLFEGVVSEVRSDLTLDAFPRFLGNAWFSTYLRCKMVEQVFAERGKVSPNDFSILRVLGRGAFGMVAACRKKDTGRLYAMKQINKKRVQATESWNAIMSERNFLAAMESKFVTILRYAFMDRDTLYLVMDLMVGGDLKYHLNNEKIFSAEKTVFYSAQVLLGLEHIHKKGIIYRDLKLENVLLDDCGNVKLSDLGLAVEEREGGVRGYAGTPGYTAPEVVLSHYYDRHIDFFSFGVMVYRFLCGRKPYESRRKRTRDKDRHQDRRAKTSELDRNVVEMEPEFPNPYFTQVSRSFLKGLLCKNPRFRLGKNGIDEIKQHAFFDSIDFGLLEAGHVVAPFIPVIDEIHSDHSGIGRPPNDEKWASVRLTPELEEKLVDFPYVSQKVFQEELVSVLESVVADRRVSLNANDSQMSLGPIDFEKEADNSEASTKCASCKGCLIM